MKNNKGFTIIELIVVIAIIGTLSAIVMTNVVGYKHKAQLAAVNQELSLVPTVATDYFFNNSTFKGLCHGVGNQPSPGIARINNWFASLCVGWCAGSCIDGNDQPISCGDDKWYYLAQISETETFCIDSSGKRSNDWDSDTCACQ